MAQAIKIQNLTKSYGSVDALRGVNIEINEGEFLDCLGQMEQERQPQ